MELRGGAVLLDEERRAVQRLQWYVRLRWGAVLALYTSAFAARAIGGYGYALGPINLLAPLVLAYNLAVWRQIAAWQRHPPVAWRRQYRLAGNLQCIADLVVLTLGLHYSGGVESWGGGLPIVAVLVVAALVLPPRDSAAQGVLACVLFDGLLLLEATGVVDHVAVGNLQPERVTSARFVASVAVGFNVVALFIVYLVVFLANRLQERERQLAALYVAEREAVERLEELDRLKSNFLATVSHELRTPLTGILGFAKHLRARWARIDDAGRREQIAAIESQAERLHRLVEDLLDLSALEAGATVVQPRPFELAGAVGQAIAASGITGVEVEVPACTWVRADPHRTEQVLVNLLENARKYGAPPVRVAAAVAGDEIVVSVTDSGEGVPEERTDVFNPFTQLDSGSTRASSGVGLGLALVKGYVEAQGGRVWYSRGEGGGAAFSFTLPAGRG